MSAGAVVVEGQAQAEGFEGSELGHPGIEVDPLT
jgi:hypothetical protein